MTNKEFEVLRDDILKTFHSIDIIKDNFKIKRSTYNWSSKHNWIINVEAYFINPHSKDKTPIIKINAIKTLLDTAYSFINNDERNFEFVDIYGMTGQFSFTFQFQPKKERIKHLLKGK